MRPHVHLSGQLICRDDAESAVVSECLPRHVELTRPNPGACPSTSSRATTPSCGRWTSTSPTTPPSYDIRSESRRVSGADGRRASNGGTSWSASATSPRRRGGRYAPQASLWIVPIRRNSFGSIWPSSVVVDSGVTTRRPGCAPMRGSSWWRRRSRSTHLPSGPEPPWCIWTSTRATTWPARCGTQKPAARDSPKRRSILGGLFSSIRPDIRSASRRWCGRRMRNSIRCTIAAPPVAADTISP